MKSIWRARAGQAEAELNAALNAINLGQVDALVAATTRSLALLDGVARPDLLGDALLGTAMMRRRLGQIEESVAMAMQGMDVARRSGDALVLVYAEQALGQSFEQLTRSNAEQLAALRRQQSRQRWLWSALLGIGAVLAGAAVLLLRLRRSHRVIGALNVNLEQRVRDGTAELRRQTRYLGTLIDTLPWSIWFKDTDCRYLAANRAAATCGVSAAAMVGRADTALWPAALAAELQRDDRAVMAARHGRSIEERLGAAGDERWFETFKTVVLDEDGSVLGTVGYSREISERKTAEATRLARMRRDFLAQMSHELRTPLTGILGYAHVLRRERDLGQRQLAGLHVIEQSGFHLLELVNEVLDLAKIEAGKLELQAGDVGLARGGAAHAAGAGNGGAAPAGAARRHGRHRPPRRLPGPAPL